MKRALIILTAVLFLFTITAPAATARCNKACTMKRLLVNEDRTWQVVPQRQILKLGRTLCELLDDGYGHVELVEYMSESFDEDWSIQLLAASVVVLCPRHSTL